MVCHDTLYAVVVPRKKPLVRCKETLNEASGVAGLLPQDPQLQVYYVPSA